MGQNVAIAEWLLGIVIVIVIVGVEGYVRPAIAFRWFNILYIVPKWMI